MRTRILGLLAATALTTAGLSAASAADLPVRLALELVGRVGDLRRQQRGHAPLHQQCVLARRQLADQARGGGEMLQPLAGDIADLQCADRLGDIVGAEGRLFKTRTGELSLHATSIRMLTKSLRPMPDKFHGVADQEVKPET